MAPTNAGSYALVGTVNDANYVGTASGTLTIAKATTPVILGNLSPTYDGTPKTPSATTTPANLLVTYTYNSSPTAPTNAGSYAIVGTVNDANYAGSATGTLVIGKATAPVVLGSLSPTYDGTPKAATATTTPANLAVSFTYNSSPTAPTNGGSYAVIGTINDPNYAGTATGTLVIAKAAATVSLNIPAPAYDGTPKSVTATTTPTGLTVTFTYNTNSTAPTNAGTYAVVGTINDTNYAGTASGSLTIGKGAASILVGSLSATYTGSPKSATVITTPAGLTTTFTYNGSSTAPTNAGNYPVVVTVTDLNYAGSTTGTLVIAKAAATVALDNLTATYDGTAKSATITTVPAGLATTVTYAGAATAPAGAGTYPVVATITDPNYTGSASGTLTIAKSTVTIALGQLNQTYDGTPRIVTTLVTPAAPVLSLTYSGSATAPTNAGSYDIAVTAGNANSTGSATGTLVVAKASQTVTFNAPATSPVVGTAVALTGTASSSLPITFSVVSGNATLSGTSLTLNDTSPVVIRAAQAGNSNYNAASADLTLTAGKVSQTITFATLVDRTSTAAPIALSATATSGLPTTFMVVSGPASVSGTTLTLNGTAGTVVVRASQAGNGTYNAATPVDRSFNVTVALIAPAITSQPQPQVALVGGTATFTVVATGNPAPGFQWRKNSGAIAGATSSTFTIANAQTGDAASYDVVVSNSVGSVTSAPASLTVSSAATAPVITRQPANVTLAVGRTATFSVAASGAPAPTYQWRSTSGPISGATTDTLTLSNLTTGQAGNYSVVVSNSAGSVTSHAAVLTVLAHSYAGSYFGTLSGGGSFAIVIHDDNTGIFLGFSPGSNTAYVSRTISVDDNGNFSFTASTSSSSVATEATSPGFEPQAAQVAASDLVFQGSISSGGQLSGSVAGNAGLSFSATKSPDTGSTQSTAGFFQAGAAGSSAQTFIIVSPTGQAFVLTQSATGADAGVGTVDSTGKLNVTTANKSTISVAVATDSTITASVTDSKGVTTTFSGVGENSAALANQRLLNISTRARAGTDAQIVIAGFVITGEESKSVLIRAVGPTLAGFGVSGTLAAPKLDLMQGNTLIATNTNWTTGGNSAAIAAAGTRAGAFPLATSSADSALLVTLAPGAYTVFLSGTNGQTGVGLVEVYDLSNPSLGQRLINISTRAVAGTGNDSLIAGVVVGGSAPKRLLIRAAGPSLAQFGLTGVLARPQLTLYAGSTVTAQNAGWSISTDATAIASAAAQVGAFAFAAGSLDAAVIVNLPPGAYSAVVTGVNATTGLSLIEVYELP